MKINVGSVNPKKIEAVKEVWEEYNLESAEFKGLAVASDVPAQPITLAQIVNGATNRAKNAYKDCDISIGIESGILPAENTITGYLGACGCIIYDGRQIYFGMGDAFEYPSEVIRLVIEKGMEIDEAFKQAGFTDNPRIGYANGVIGFLTNNRITRKDLAKSALKMALVTFLNKELYKKIKQ